MSVKVIADTVSQAYKAYKGGSGARSGNWTLLARL
jgi:hypothetical protein